MKPIEQIEKHLPQNRKALLHCLRTSNWQVLGVDDSLADWSLDETWLIESTRENKGMRLQLWMYHHDGLHDAVDEVVATTEEESPGPNSPVLDFLQRGTDRHMSDFVARLHHFRISGTW